MSVAATPSQNSLSTSRGLRVLAGVLFLFACCRLVLPGDTYFVNDEPLLLLRALDDNAAGKMTSFGLRGSRGVDYGPFAIWVYRLGLSLTHNLLAILTVKIALIASITGLCIYHLAKLCPQLFAPFGVVALLSPYLWFYGRDLWDNSFVIPLSAGAVVSYLIFCKSKKVVFLFLAAIAATFSFLTHLMVIPLLASLAAHFVIFHFHWLKKNFVAAAAIAITCLAISYPYLTHLLKQHPGNSIATGDLGHLLTPLMGPRFFTDLGLEYILDSHWVRPFSGIALYLWWAVLGVTAIAYPIAWWGIVFAALELWISRNERSLLFHMCFLSIVGLAVQMLLSVSYRLIPAPYIHNSLWVFYFFFLWLGATRLSKFHFGKKALGVYVTSLALGLVALIADVHTRGGNREQHFGPTLANQLAIAHQISLYENTPVTSDARYAKEFPWAVEALKRLSNENPGKKAQSLRIVYETPANSTLGKVKLEVEN